MCTRVCVCVHVCVHACEYLSVSVCACIFCVCMYMHDLCEYMCLCLHVCVVFACEHNYVGTVRSGGWVQACTALDYFMPFYVDIIYFDYDIHSTKLTISRWRS